jgi:hypothetical protein
MKRNILFVLLAVVSIGCKKGEDGPVGGKGGNATLRITPKHHGRAIDSCTLYIRYNEVNPPADGRYDDSAKCVPSGGIPVATFTGLKTGNYYLYANGWDPVIVPANYVKGGLSYTISTETTLNLDVPVSEGD